MKITAAHGTATAAAIPDPAPRPVSARGLTPVGPALKV
jgi:hypothetical protein